MKFNAATSEPEDTAADKLDKLQSVQSRCAVCVSAEQYHAVCQTEQQDPNGRKYELSLNTGLSRQLPAGPDVQTVAVGPAGAVSDEFPDNAAEIIVPAANGIPVIPNAAVVNSAPVYAVSGVDQKRSSGRVSAVEL